MRTLAEINKGCPNCNMPKIMLCGKCMKELHKTLMIQTEKRLRIKR